MAMKLDYCTVTISKIQEATIILDCSTNERGTSVFRISILVASARGPSCVLLISSMQGKCDFGLHDGLLVLGKLIFRRYVCL